MTPEPAGESRHPRKGSPARCRRPQSTPACAPASGTAASTLSWRSCPDVSAWAAARYPAVAPDRCTDACQGCPRLSGLLSASAADRSNSRIMHSSWHQSDKASTSPWMSGWPSSSWLRADSISTRHRCSSASSDLPECSAIAFKSCLLASEVLPPENGQFDVLRIYVHAVANALGDLSSNESCSTS